MKKKLYDPDQELEEEMKSAYQEEGKHLHLSEEFKRDLLAQMKQVRDKEWTNEDKSKAGDGIQSGKTEEKTRGRIRRIKEFLNREVEVPLVPLVAASLLFMMINFIPINYEPRPEGRLIDVGGAQLWIPNNGEGEETGYEN